MWLSAGPESPKTCESGYNTVMKKGLTAGGGMILGMLIGMLFDKLALGMIFGLMIGAAAAARRKRDAKEL